MTGDPAGPESRARRTTIPGVHRSEPPGMGKGAGAWASHGSPPGVFPRSDLEVPGSAARAAVGPAGFSACHGSPPCSLARFLPRKLLFYSKEALASLARRMWGVIRCKHRARGVRSWNWFWKRPVRVSGQ